MEFQGARSKGERARARRIQSIEEERPSALKRERPTLTADENDQRISDNDDDLPGPLPVPPKPPDEPATPEKAPPSFKLEGEHCGYTSREVGCTSAEPDASGVLSGVEDPRSRPKKLQNVLERLVEQLEQVDEKDSPRATPGDPDEPGRNVQVPA